MKIFKTTQVLLSLLIFISFPFHVKAQNLDVEKMHELYVNTINTGNINNLDVLYTKNASIRNTNGNLVSGLEDIKAQYKATFASGKYNITLKTIDKTELNKNYMFVSGAFIFNKVDDPKSIQNGQFVNTLKKINGDWKIYKSYRYAIALNNTSIVNDLYKAFSVGDIPAALDTMDANIIWNEAEGNALAVGNPYLGPYAVLQGVFAKLPVDFDGFNLSHIKPHEMSNNQVLATLRYNAISKHNGKTLNAQAAHLWTVKDGKITAFQQYIDTKQLDEMLKK
ncbi:nuclear transport factor 2 family protein [uncultured Algibacter sp.]|uniref:nuclear transport factor 2 family protein n=1 Tax=uncultured Algibacter sp. TaxID=298659 RepID=UPI00261B0B95|nr:nuclear transport factor 2 family protein [uncultured Algibacter sp.]